MFVSDVLRRSGRNLRQAKARTILTALAIGVGSFTLTLTLAASNGAKTYVNGIISENFDPAELIVAKDESLFGSVNTNDPQKYDDSFGVGQSGAGAAIPIKQLDQEDLKTLQSIEGIENVRINATVSLEYLVGPNGERYIGTIQAENPFQNYDLIAGMRDDGFEDGEVLLPNAYINELGYESPDDSIGKSVTLAVRKQPDIQALLTQIQQGENPQQLIQASQDSIIIERTFTIAGVLKEPSAAAQPGTELYLYGTEKAVNELNEINTKGTEGYRKYTNVFVRVENGEDDAVLQEAQRRIEQAGFASFSVEDTQAFLNQAINVLQGIVAAFSMIAVIAALFGVINTMYISVLQRTREIGLMKALGMRKRDINKLFLFEAAWIGFLGGALGAVLALGLGLALNPWITETLDLGEGVSLLEFQVLEIIGLVVGLMAVAVIAGLFPARKAAKLDPIEALRTE